MRTNSRNFLNSQESPHGPMMLNSWTPVTTILAPTSMTRASHRGLISLDGRSRRFLSYYSIWSLLFAISTTLGVVLNNSADCLTNNNGENPSSPSASGERVWIIKHSPTSPKTLKQTNKPFREQFDQLTIHVKENTPIGTKLADIQPRTANETAYQQHNDKIIYEIVGGDDQQSFTLRVENTLNKVELVNEVNFDYESSKRNYNIIIRALSSSLRYEVTIDILVTDENDNKPQLEDFSIVFNNYKNNFPSGPIGRVPAIDLDIDDVLHYRVLSGNNAQLIYLNESNGDIQLSPWLNSNVPLKAVMEIAVSDGFNEAVAKLVLTVNLVTETMLHNSVVLRLDGVGRDDFLSRKYDMFLSQMAHILGTSNKYGSDNIVVFDVEESYHQETLSSAASLLPESPIHYRPFHGSSIINTSISVNVSFSARADGNDLEAYMSSQYIEERVFLARGRLAQNLEVQVAPFQDNMCLHEPCQNYQECQATYKFDKAPKMFYTNRNMIFRPIKAIQSYTCTCPPTFTGMKHKNECNLQINQCFSNPCLNGGICHRHESGYTCECRPEFIGQKCEHSFANSTCQSIATKPATTPLTSQISSYSSNLINAEDLYKSSKQQSTMCSGKSRCVNLNKAPYHLGKPTSSISGGFICQGCPYPQWSNDRCQLRARSFDKNSYITLPSLKRRHRFHLMLQFATVQNDAILLYNGRYNEKHDFIALEIVNSRLRFSYSLGGSITSVSLSTMTVSNGDWHKVAIDYRDRNVTLIVDDCDPVIDETLARIQGLSMTKRCSNTSYDSGDASSNEFKMLDLTSPMQVGALPPSSGDYQISSQQASFSGCMSDIYIDHQLVDLSMPIHDFGTQPGCPEKRTFCQQHSCNGAPCQEFYDSAKCNCGDERLGKSCEIYLSHEKVRKFSGNSYLTFNPIVSQISSNWQVSLHFRTINPNGVLFKISLDPESSITLELFNGGVKLTHRQHSLVFNKILLDDGEWHYVEILWSSDSTMLRVDYNQNLAVHSNDLGNVVGSVMKSVMVGAALARGSSSSLSSSQLSSGSVLVGDNSLPQAPETSSDYGNLAGSTAPPPPLSSTDELANYGSNSSQSFVGCIYGLNISDNIESWIAPNEERNVERGCPIVDVCETNQCPPNSRCIRKGMNQRKCVCNPGFVGDQCIPVCDLNPCQGENSRCIPIAYSGNNSSNTGRSTGDLQVEPFGNTNNDLNIPTLMISSSAQYSCECEPHRSGKNCENQLSPRCPSNWWGKPVAGSNGSNSSICGPCNCEDSKGFDGDCDKTTGHCFCKPSHYQPVGSDYCLACDCYLVGSLSSSCNQTSGQCKCRPGVVGRRCDTCTSPYAEVTLRGCEVIYDACPKTYSDGIWWDKTQLDRVATQQCPVATSTGTATRFCHRTEGWQKANLFDCISNTFSDLYTQYQFLEENKFQMTTNLAMKIATNLRTALNETISSPERQLYGSDIYISFRLIHHLIQHESHQTGLNLTHRQDRMYIRNIAESISYILDPAYAENWPEIAARSPNGGAEHLLRLIDTYGRILIDSQSDTYTQPFELSTKYLTFGMDILSTEQLWDLSKWSLSSSSSSSSVNSNLNQASGSIGLHFPSSPPYATDPFEISLDSRQTGASAAAAGVGRHNEQQVGQYNSDGSSIYLDHSATRDGSPSIIVPKYDNYVPLSDDSTGQLQQDTSKALVPLKTLRVKTPQEFFPPYYPARSRAKRDDLIISDYPSGNNLKQQKPALVVYSIYRSLGPLLPTNYDSTVQNRLGMLAVANSPVVWLTMRPANSSEFLSKNIQPKITYILKMIEPAGKARPQCAVWSFINQPSSAPSASSQAPAAGQNKSSSSTYGVKQTGRFTTKGCEIKGIHPNHRLRYKYDYINCSCDHLGAVTVLMDSTANYDYLSGEETNFKDMVLLISLGISVFILVSTMFVLSCIRGHSVKSNSNSINKNLILILIIIDLMIFYIIYSKSSLNQREYQCKLVAIFLHYFSISLFFWLLVNAIHFYRMLTELRDINHGPMKFYHVVGYAVPAFFVSIAVGLRIEQFGNYLFCWLSIHEPIIWSMFGPISVVSLITVALFLLALCRALPVKEDPTGAELIKSHMLINIVKTPTIGIYWLITVYTVNEALVDHVYLFPMLTIFKSLVLFVLLCIIDKYIRYNIYVSWLRFKGEKIPFIEDHTNYPHHSRHHHQYMVSGMMSNAMIQSSGLIEPYGKHHSAGHLYGAGKQALTPGFQSSCTDIFRPELLAGLSAASTTSRSTATGTSSSVAYRDHRQQRIKESHRVDVDDDYGRTGRRHKRRGHKKHRKHHHHHRHHHHHHHRSHHHDEDDHYHHHHRHAGNADGDDANDYGHATRSRRHHHHQANSGGGHCERHHHQRRHHHHHQHQQQESVSNSLSNQSQNDLASSHSSDQDDVSTLPKKQAIYNTATSLSNNQQQQHHKNSSSSSSSSSSTPVNLKPGAESQSSTGATAAATSSGQQQTLPMELLAPSTSSDTTSGQQQQQQQQQQQHQDNDKADDNQQRMAHTST